MIALYISLGVVFIIFCCCIRIVPQAHEYVIECFGKYRRTLSAGFHVLIPFAERVCRKITLMEQILDATPQPVITKDNVTMQIDTVVYFKVFDAELYTYGVENPVSAIETLTATTLRNIIGELELAYRLGDGTYIAITGTNGKTTTTTLVGEIFKAAKKKTHVVGNIGVAVISESKGSKPDDFMITETSSFQLETIKEFRPVVSAILNLTPDHLNRHHTFENYGLAKARVFENQDENEYLVINYDDKECYKLAAPCKAKVVPFSRKEELDFGAFVKDDKVVICNEMSKIVEICHKDDIQIIGSHNLENVLAASAICYFAGIDPITIGNAVKAFPGVEHRIEYSGTVNGVKYYNDSKGTNVDAAVTAINAIDTNIIIIAGGDGKGQDFAPFVEKFAPKVKTLLAIGRDGKIIADEAKKIGFEDIVFVKDMDEAVEIASEKAMPGDSVLLSPACASWDMYKNFEERGNHFKNCVKNLEKKNN